MSANKYRIRISELSGTTDTYLNIPVTLTPQMTDQSELVDRKFVDVEVEKAINPILDYEKARFTPIYFPDQDNLSNYSFIDNITYNVKFLNSSGFPTSPSMYGDISISDDDIRFGKKRFENSFLNLSFYDTDRATDQRLISFINVFPRLTASDLQSTGDPKPGLPKPASQIPISFTLSNPIKDPAGFAEGFYIYNYKDEVTSNLPKELYMRARFNNASDGKTTNMMTESLPFYIDDLVNKLYTKYVLYRNNTGFYYAIDESYSNNINRVGNDITVDIYEIQAL
jgi:hypothetical protein